MTHFRLFYESIRFRLGVVIIKVGEAYIDLQCGSQVASKSSEGTCLRASK